MLLNVLLLKSISTMDRSGLSSFRVLIASSKRVLFPEFTGPLIMEYCGTSFKVPRKAFSSLE